MTLVPAYGRDYKSAKAAIADFLANKDFRICDMSSKDDGRYVTHTELKSDMTGKTVQIRFKNLMGVCVVKIGK